MSVSPEFTDYLHDQLGSFGAVTIRSMFGGGGLFRDGIMFGLIASETLYLKTGNANRAEYEAAGMGPFTYSGKSKPVSMSYHEVPADVLEDPDLLCDWAGKAFAVAHAAKAAAPPKRKRRKKAT
ncbi:MAG: TfoX/Sxy family protein [Alphaproteobacteria bacterium]|nr:TfoX/Sxy family protein [Alphaproteobacteria bacterium]